MKEFILDGKKFNTPNAFYKYAESLFTFGLDWETGRNLDAFDDLLRGGFGQHEYEEIIRVTWINFSKSRERLPNKFFEDLNDILEKSEYVTLEKYNREKK